MKITVYNTTEPGAPHTAELAALPDLLKSTTSVVWVDMIGPNADDVHVLRDTFHFHPLAIEDTLNKRQRPKVEEYTSYMFSILNLIEMQEEEVVFHEIDVFVGRNYLVTVHQLPHHRLDTLHQRLEDACRLKPMSVGYLLYTLIDVVVDSYFPILDSIGDEIEEIGDVVLDNPRPPMLERLFRLKRTLSEMWRVVNNQRDMFGILTRENSELVSEPALRYYLRDVHDHLIRISDTVNTFRDTLSNVVDLYMSSVSNRLNQQVNRLTIVTMGIGILAVITGFYGMNFEHTWPPFDSPWGVPYVVMLIIITVCVVLYVVYRQRR